MERGRFGPVGPAAVPRCGGLGWRVRGLWIVPPSTTTGLFRSIGGYIHHRTTGPQHALCGAAYHGGRKGTASKRPPGGRPGEGPPVGAGGHDEIECSATDVDDTMTTGRPCSGATVAHANVTCFAFGEGTRAHLQSCRLPGLRPLGVPLGAQRPPGRREHGRPRPVGGGLEMDQVTHEQGVGPGGELRWYPHHPVCRRCGAYGD